MDNTNNNQKTLWRTKVSDYVTNVDSLDEEDVVVGISIFSKGETRGSALTFKREDISKMTEEKLKDHLWTAADSMGVTIRLGLFKVFGIEMAYTPND